MKRTPLFDAHAALGAKLVDFAGWEMPIQYSGVVDEYQTVRTAAGLFDVSHMGRVTVEGRDAVAFLQRVTTNNVETLPVGAAQYSMVCNPTGGIKDDIFVYRLGPTRFLLCINASNHEKIVSWLCAKAPQGDVRLSDESDELAQIALQGPESQQILRAVCPRAADTLKPRQCVETEVLGASRANRMTGIVSRTGYTGEVGYELYVPSSSAKVVWEGLMKAGEEAGIKPCGLGARDLLRLEVGYLLYGNDIDEQTTPLEAGAAFAVDFTKGEFIGRPTLLEQKEKGPAKRLVGFELLQKGVPRHGMKIVSDGQVIGIVTSGNLSPRLQKGIGLGYVQTKFSETGTQFQVDIRDRAHPAVVVTLPFYKRK
ncbi:MAG: glycine cleavage system aminomethyltransferase GcvT [Nitrospirae bacterium]|nr:glycine cleavage system aminomethyltransferase GcvT [Nitrospirota bacterium]